jgi:hypothetical protein
MFLRTTETGARGDDVFLAVSRPLVFAGGKLDGVTTRERLHELVDELSEREADDALRYIARRREDPTIAAFRDAPEDDEPVTDADDEALAEVRADRAAGVPRISYAEIKSKHG